MTSSLGDLGSAFGGSAAASLGGRLTRRGTAPAPPPPSTGLTGMLKALPAPTESRAEGPLSEQEREHLRMAEQAIRTLPLAFVVVGKALQVINDGRLYRETHATFAEYLAEWDLKTSHAYRLMESWRLGEALALSPMGDKINERQVRELLPVAARHGQDAAVTVYRTVAETEGVKVTAALLGQVVQVLPETWDEDEAVARIRAYLAGDAAPLARRAAPVPAVEVFLAQSRQLRTALRRVIADEALRAVAAEDPDQVRQLAAELRAAADQLDASAHPSA